MDKNKLTLIEKKADKLTKAMILKARQTGINRKHSEDDLLRIFKKTLK